MRMRPLVVGFLLGLAAAGRAEAKNISLTMTPTATVADGTLSVQLTVVNRGDEAAQTVVPTLRFQDREARGKGRSSLGPNETLEETLTLSAPAPELTNGRWPYRLAIDYTDANQYPFQALHVATVESGNPPPAKVVVSEIQAPALSSSGSYSVKVKNLTGSPRNAAVAVLVPEGLEVPGTPPQVSLNAWEEKAVAGAIVNRTAVAGSRYPVCVG